jgi:hypothetical protein
VCFADTRPKGQVEKTVRAQLEELVAREDGASAAWKARWSFAWTNGALDEVCE